MNDCTPSSSLPKSGGSGTKFPTPVQKDMRSNIGMSQSNQFQYCGGHICFYFIFSDTYRTSYFAPGTTPMPDWIRSEVSLIKNDFNMRLKQVAFNSICSAYYAAFIPCAFATVRTYSHLCVQCVSSVVPGFVFVRLVILE